jgi:FKBP-type peptidyl-prolyl cis-trans isomerase
MNLKWLAIAIMFFAAAPTMAQEEQALKTQKEKFSYAIGINAARNMQRQKLDLDIEMLIKALRDAYQGNTLAMSEDEVRTVLEAYQKEQVDKLAQAAKLAAEKNKKDGETFLAENKTKEGIVALDSGLQYKILKAGDGKMPTDEDTIEVNYRGTLIDGTEFDSSYKRGQSTTFPLKQAIPGWKVALKLMPVGSKWQLFIPAELAYGARGVGQTIGPNATLIFEVELLSIKPVSSSQ